MPTRSGALKRTPPQTPAPVARSQSAATTRPVAPDARITQSVEVLSAEPEFAGAVDEGIADLREKYGLNYKELGPEEEDAPVEDHTSNQGDWITRRKGQSTVTARNSPAYARYPADAPVTQQVQQETLREETSRTSKIESLLGKILENQTNLTNRITLIENSRASSRSGRSGTANIASLNKAADDLVGNIERQRGGNQDRRDSGGINEFNRDYPAPPSGMDESHLRFIKSQEDQLKARDNYIARQAAKVRELRSQLQNLQVDSSLPQVPVSTSIPTRPRVLQRSTGAAGGAAGGAGGGHGNGGNDYSSPFPDNGNRNDREPVREKSYYLKADEIGIFDPKSTEIPVSIWCRRVQMLAARHGEQAVLRNIDKALVKVSVWLTGLSHSDIKLQESVDGWISLIQRDFGISKALALRNMHDFTWNEADDALDYINRKLSLLQESGIYEESIQCGELVSGLPTRWRETLSTNDYIRVSPLRKAIRNLEIARDGWPKSKISKPARGDKGTKRGGGFESPNYRKKYRGDEEKSDSKPKPKKKPPSPCPNCKRSGKSDEEANHWMDDCPMKAAINNKKAAKTTNFVENESSSEESETEKNEHQSNESSSSEDEMFFVQTCATEIVSRIPSVEQSSSEIVDSLPEKEKWRSNGRRFENQSPTIVMARSSSDGHNFPIMCDTGSAASLIGRDTFKSIWPDKPIHSMSDSELKIKSGWNGKDSEKLTDYASPAIYLPTEDGRLVKVYLELHITDKKIGSPGILIGSADMDYNNMNTSYTYQCIEITPLQSLETYRIPMATSKKKETIPEKSVRSSKKVKIPARSTGYVPVNLTDLRNGPFFLQPKGKFHGKNHSLCSSPFMVVSADTNILEYSNFSSDDVFIQEGQVLGQLSDLDPDDVYVQALSHEERRNGVKLDKMMSNIPKDFMETDEIEVGLSEKDLNISSISTKDVPSSDNLPPGF